MTKVVVSPEAEGDLHEIALYIAAAQPAAARRLILSFKELCGQLGATPHIGPVRDFGLPEPEGVRMMPVPGFANYLVFYRVSDDASRVEIWRLTDGRRDLPNLLADWSE